MKRYITYIIAILSLAYVASCTKTDDIANPNDSGRMTLLLQSSIMTRSADDTEGLNEDVVSSVDCYFYPANSSADANAVWHCKVTPTPVSESSGSYEIKNIDMKSGDIAKVFPNGSTTAKVYIIANYPGNDLPTAEANNLSTGYGSSIATLKAKIIQQTWGGENPSFVMDSDGTATVTKDGSAVSNGTTPIYLTRAAAKIELTITSVKSEVKGADGCTYVPALGDTGENIGITMHNAAIKSWIDNAWDANNSKLAYTSDSYESFSGYTFAKVDGKQQYKQTVPFYSYPTHWGQGSTSGEAYLLLVVKWKKTKDENGNSVANASPQSCYYEIPIGQLDTQNNVVSEYIERNHHYQISIDVGTLGSFVQENPVTLSPLYMVVDWTSGEIAAQLTEKRYLVVDQTEIEIFNQTDCAISYASSHPVTATIDSIVFNSYKLANTRKIKITSSAKTITPTASNLSIADVYTDYDLSYGTVNGAQSITTLPKGNATFGFTHAIPTYYTPRTIYVTVQHTDDESFSEQVKIIQYPPIYFIGEKATGRVYVNEQYTEDNGIIYVYDDDQNNIGSIRDPSTVESDDDATNMNENNYDIHVTVLPSGSKWQIGDPRETTGTTLSGIDELTKYRKTRTDAVNVIAPAFKIASSRGRTTDMSFANAAKRCASYQENGFPAGRWRVPTPAEIEFIVSRSADGDIPSLFDGEYWAANGQYFDSNDKQLHTTSNNQAVRCVYDVWYWGEDNIKGALNTPVWGDAKNNATLNAENPVN